MGGYNILCGASHQVITPKHKVKLMAISQTVAHSPVTLRDPKGGTPFLNYGSVVRDESSSLWSPYSSFIDAEYADFGKFTFNMEGKNKKVALMLIASLIQDAFITEADASGEYENAGFNLVEFVKDNAKDLSDLISKGRLTTGSVSPSVADKVSEDSLITVMSYVLDRALRNLIFIKSKHQTVVPLHFYVVSDVAYWTFIKNLESKVTWIREQPVDRVSFVTSVVKEAISSIEALEDEAPDGEEANFDEKLGAMVGSIKSTIWADIRYVSLMSSVYSYDLSAICNEFLKAESRSKEALINKLIPMTEEIYALIAIDSIGSLITPVKTAGQDYDNELGYEYASIISQISDVVQGYQLLSEYESPSRNYSALFRSLSPKDIAKIKYEFNDHGGYFIVDSASYSDLVSQETSNRIFFKCPFDFDKLSDIVEELGLYSDIFIDDVEEVD